MNFILEEIVAATSGEIIRGCSKTRIRGVSTNSKTVKPGDLFIAIVGEKFDAHEFLPEVASRGAVAIVVSRAEVSIPEGIAAIRVKDTVRALGMIARAYRDRFPIPVIGITGSAGKTTTKEMLALVLSAKYRVLKNSGTENNHIGVPLTLLKLRPSHDIVIVEMGTNRFGDIPWLVQVARPTMAILTNIGESHLAELKSPADVFKEKSALIKAIPQGGMVVVNNDDPFLRRIRSRDRRHHVITYGIKDKADYHAQGLTVDARHRLLFEVNRNKGFVLKTPVPAFVSNALVAITCGRVFKINYNNIKGQLAKFRPRSGRQGLLKIGGYYLLDDSYNANPVSFRCALETLSCLNVRGRKILVCGDMLELGERTAELHREVGAVAAQRGVDAIFSFGTWAREIGVSAQQKRSDIVSTHHDSIETLVSAVLDYCRRGDAILVKASRGMHLERVVDVLKTQLG